MPKISLFILVALTLAGPGFAAAGKDQTSAPPDPAMDRINQAALLVKQKDFDTALTKFIAPAIAEFEKEYAGRPERIYCARGPVETLLYMTQSAEKNEPALAVGASYAFAYYLKGYILVDRGDFKAALPFLQKAADLSPANAQFLSELGHVLQQYKEWQKSLEIFDRAIEGARLVSEKSDHSSELRRALRGRGYCLIELRRYDEAEKAYAECLELDPTDATAKGELGYIKDLRAKAAPAK